MANYAKNYVKIVKPSINVVLRKIAKIYQVKLPLGF